MVGRQPVLQIGEQLDQLFGEIVGRGLAAVALQGEGGLLVAARRAAEAEIDALRKKPGEHGERLGDLERAVMRQHDAAAADADALRRGGDRPDQRLRAGAGEHRRAVMLGDPVARITEAVAELREVEAVRSASAPVEPSEIGAWSSTLRVRPVIRGHS